MRIDATPPQAAVRQPSTNEISDGLERAFLSEMLKYAGPKPIEGGFSGGIGESQFASLLSDAYADALSARLDLGLATKTGGKA
jgi:hypothetical protein